MNKQSIFFTFLVAIIAAILMYYVISIFAKKNKIKTLNSGTISSSLGLWYLSFLIPFFMLLKISLEMIESSIEIIIYSTTIDNTFISVMEKIVIFIGFPILFIFFLYYIVDLVFQIFFGKRIESIEIENNNTNYFIQKLVFTTLLTYVLLNIYDHFLRWFVPVIETPFYH
jgi:hypothetical protein